MIRRIALPLALLLLLALSAGAAVTAVDADGVTVTLADPSRRIVSLVPSSTEILYALGLEDRLVGVSGYCDYPPAARDKPKVGDLATTSVETVLALRPDLVLAHFITPEPLRRQLRIHGVTVFTLSPRSVHDVLDDITLVGRLCGAIESASRVRQGLEGRIAAARAAVGSATGRPGVYFGNLRPPLWAACANDFADELIRLAGGRNVCAPLGDHWQAVPLEHVVAANPDVIVTAVHPEDFSAAHRDAELARLRGDPVWSQIAAVRAGRLYLVDEDWTARSGPRMVDALEAFARAIHPECFPAP